MSSAAAEGDCAIRGLTQQQVRAALEQANPNVLRLALYQATRDPELARMQVGHQPFWGGAFQVAVLDPKHAPVVREKAFRFLQSETHGPAEAPADAELRRMMELLNGAPVSDFAYAIGRGDLVDEPFPLGVAWTREPPQEVKAGFKVVVVGAGLAGLATAIQLDRLGLPFEVIERNDGVGGTWWTNAYPEARVDIASHHYQYSFMKNYPWRHYYATQAELKDYAEAVAARFDLQRRIRFRTELTHARWNEALARWELTVRKDGREEILHANAIISAAGLFNEPNLPDIPGIESFQGRMFHTTQWDHGCDYAGARVGQIGVGSTGAQLMPEVARKAGRLTVFQRSPQWVTAIDGYRDAVSAEVQWLFDNFPHYWSWYSFFVFMINMGGDPEGLQNYDRSWRQAGGLVSQRNDELRAYNKRYILSQIGDRPDLVAKLTPDFPPFAKRPVVDNGWFQALKRDNVELVTEPISRITPAGVRTADGRLYECDLLLLCAGFKVERYLWPVRYEGRGGVTLEEAWSRDGARAYLGITVPDFPNLFMVYGPNGQGRAGGLIKWLEIWSAYALKSIVALVESGSRAMSVKREVYDDYNARMDRALEDCIWSAPGQKSYYLNAFGRQNVNMPWKPHEYYEWARAPDLADYEIR